MAERDGPVTVAFSRVIRNGREPEFERWAKDISDAASRWPGYLGTTVMRPAYEANPPGTGHPFTSVYRFASEGEWQAWAGSEERRALVARADAISEPTHEAEHREGLDYWFELPGAPAPNAPAEGRIAKWKMAVIVTAFVFALLHILAPLFTPLRAYLPLPLVQFLSVATSVGLMTWILLPAATRLLRGWLFAKPEAERDGRG